MKPTTLSDTGPLGALDPVILEVRTRFVADFPMRCDAAAELIERAWVADDRAEAARSLRAMAHRLAGLAGIVGFSRVSTLASNLEDAAGSVETGVGDPTGARDILESLRTAFAQELAGRDASGGVVEPGTARGHILLAEDDPDQRAIVVRHLSQAGYEVEAVDDGPLVFDAARAMSPAVLLLDVEMPGLDGYSVCREMKADPDLSRVPVIFMTTRARLDDRVAGLALGADDYLVKPVDPRELVIRLERAISRDLSRAEAAVDGGVLSYEDFVPVARQRLAQGTAALVLIRTTPERVARVLSRVRDEVRRADLVATFDRSHGVVLLPETDAVTARNRVAEIVQGLHDRGLEDVAAGVSTAGQPGAAGLDALLAEADRALAEARCFGRLASLAGERPPVSQRSATRSVLVADDDPDVARIVDATFRAAGYETSLAFDGAAALDALNTATADLLILDLMMPVVSGFEVLGRLAHQERRPKVIVLSARDREDDVTRAFEAGADDYVVKPFNPQELLARVARLLR